MRYLGAVALVLAGLAGLAVFAGPDARAAGPPGVPPVQLAAASATLTQQSAGTWTTTVYVDTGALCAAPVSFGLLTTEPYSDTSDSDPDFAGDGDSPQCDAQVAHPVTEVTLTFTPSPALPSVPRSATLSLTPSPAALAAGAVPLDIPLTVQRQVSAWQYVWIPALSGLLLALLLVGLTWGFGVPWPGAGAEPRRFWRIPLHASSAWTFRDSWATNISAAGALAGTALTASGSITDLLPGIELSRFSVVIAVAAGITVIAPLVFGLLNYRFSMLDPATAGVMAICVPPGAGRGEDITVSVPAGGSVTIHAAQGAAGSQAPAATVDIPVDAEITIAPMTPRTGGGCPRVLVLTGGAEIAVAPGHRITVGGTGHDAPAGALVSFPGQARVLLPAGACAQAPDDPPAPVRMRRALAGKRGQERRAEPGRPARPPGMPVARVLTIPRSGQVVPAQMWTMLAASCLTVFGIGAEIGVMGVVLGFDLDVAPAYARACALTAAVLLALLVLVYGFFAIRALADSRSCSTMSNAGNSSFTL